MSAKKKIKRKGDSFLRDAFILCIITLIAGGTLAVVFNMTKKPIQEAKDRTEIASYQAVMPEGAVFEEDERLNQERAKFKPTGMEIIKACYAKNKEGAITGYVFLITSKEGYGGSIEFSMGMKKDGTISGIEIIQMSETAGLGSKCADEEFKEQYKGLSGKLDLVKGEAKGDNEISAISGATITSKAITNAVNQVLEFVKGLEG